jgi:glycosyltransferase involved in cell wall biosynthesis
MNPPQRLRVAVLNRHFGYRFGGAERYAAAVVEELAPRHEIHVFAQEIEHDFPGVIYHRISRPLAKPRWLNQLLFAYQTWRQTRHGFDVVHSHENTWHGDLQTVHVRPFRVGLFHNRQGLKRFLKWLSLCTSPRLLTYWCLEAARFRSQTRKHIVATSSQVMAETLQAYPHTAACMQVIAPGVSLPSAPVNPIAARQLLALPQGVTLALFVGNDYAKKGLTTLLEALSHVPSLHLAVVGHGQRSSTFLHQAQQLQIADRVHFLGSLPDVSPAYAAADLLVHPTTEDTYAMVVLEAMAYGLPVVVSSTPYCGISAELKHNEQALILNDPRNAQVLGEEITRLMSTPQLILQLKTNGQLFASKRSWQAVAAAHETLFLKVTQAQSL